jgi:hypothetical protein
MESKLADDFVADFGGEVPDTEYAAIQDELESGRFIESLEQEYLHYLDTDTLNISEIHSSVGTTDDVDAIIHVHVSNVTVGAVPLNSNPVHLGGVTVKFVINAAG